MDNETKTMDIFQKIRNKAQEQVTHSIERVRKSIESKINHINQQRENKARMKNISEECEKFINDRRYVHFQEYLDECIVSGRKALQSVCSHAKTKDEQVLQAARIAAQLEVLELLKNRAMNIISEYDKINKQEE